MVKVIEFFFLDVVIEVEYIFREFDVLDVNDELIFLGWILVKFFIEFCFGKMMIMGCIFYVGDVICIIVVVICFLEFFINEGKWLGYIYWNFVGNRFFDYVVFLLVF